MVREQQVVQQMQQKLIGEIKLTPSEVRKYFSQLSQDSLPNIPTTVEVQIVTLEPKIPFEETDAIKAAYVISRSKSIPVRWNSLRWLVCTRKIRVRRLEVVSWVS